MKSAHYTTVAKVRAALHTLYRADPEIDAKQIMQRALQDEVVPKDSRGRWRVSRLTLTMAGIVIAAISIFVSFSIR